MSVPRTNRADLLQVSPLDGLTSLTRRPPGRPRAGPERYYPDERRSFLRLVPPDARIAREMVALARPARGRRIALVDTADFSPRELGAVLDAQLRRRGVVPVDHVLLKDDADGVPDKVRDLAAARPQVVLVSGEPGPVATALLAELARRLPRARVVASPALAVTAGEGSGATAVTPVLPASAQPASGRRVLRRLRRRGAAGGAVRLRRHGRGAGGGARGRGRPPRGDPGGAAADRPARGHRGDAPGAQRRRRPRPGRAGTAGRRDAAHPAPRALAVVQPVGTRAPAFARRADAVGAGGSLFLEEGCARPLRGVAQ